MTREELLAPILEAVPGAAASAFDAWDVIPGYVNGEHVCTAIMSGAEIHFAIRPEHQRKLIRKQNTAGFLQPLVERHGFLTTRIRLESSKEQRFVERLGFQPTWADSMFQYYLLTTLPFTRGEA